MLVFVDSSVWIDFFRKKPAQLAMTLGSLLDDDRVAMSAQVRLELLSGVGDSDWTRITKMFDALHNFVPTKETWKRAEDWARQSTAAGRRFGAADLVIAASAAEHNASIWSADKAFAQMAELGFVILFESHSFETG